MWRLDRKRIFGIMATPLILSAGTRFGMLEVVGPCDPLPNGKKYTTSASLFRCDCGTVRRMKNTVVARGLTVSCGCLGGDHHGMSGSSLYRVWKAMDQRCHLMGTVAQKRYMDRGISVCEEWRSGFRPFFTWAMKNGYRKGLHIDRIDNDGNYEPSNCRFVTPRENHNNKSNNIRVTYRGEVMSIMNAIAKAKKLQSAATIVARVRHGWDPEKAIDTPIRKGNYWRGPRASLSSRNPTD